MLRGHLALRDGNVQALLVLGVERLHRSLVHLLPAGAVIGLLLPGSALLPGLRTRLPGLVTPEHLLPGRAELGFGLLGAHGALLDPRLDALLVLRVAHPAGPHVGLSLACTLRASGLHHPLLRLGETLGALLPGHPAALDGGGDALLELRVALAHRACLGLSLASVLRTCGPHHPLPRLSEALGALLPGDPAALDGGGDALLELRVALAHRARVDVALPGGFAAEHLLPGLAESGFGLFGAHGALLDPRLDALLELRVAHPLGAHVGLSRFGLLRRRPREGPHHGLGLCLGDLARFHRGGEPALDRSVVLGVGDAEGEESRSEGEGCGDDPAGSPGKTIGDDHGDSGLEFAAAGHGGGHARGADALGGEEFRHAEQGARVALSFGLEGGEDEGVAGELLARAQIALGPPGDGVPPEGDGREPLHPADPVVLAAHVRQLVGEDELEVSGRHGRRECLGQDDPRPAPELPDERGHPGGHHPYLGAATKPVPSGHLLCESAKGRPGDAGAADHGELEPDGAEQRSDENERGADQPGPSNQPADREVRRRCGESPEVDVRARRGEVREVQLRQGRVDRGHRGRVRQQGHVEERRSDQLQQDAQPQGVREERVVPPAMHRVSEQRERSGDAAVAQAELDPGVSHGQTSRSRRPRAASAAAPALSG